MLPRRNHVKGVDAAARAIGLQVLVLNASTSHRIARGFALFCLSADALFHRRRPRISPAGASNLPPATRHAILPQPIHNVGYTDVRGLDYGTNVADAYRQVGPSIPVALLNGAKPADLRWCNRTKFRTGHQRPDSEDARLIRLPRCSHVAD